MSATAPVAPLRERLLAAVSELLREREWADVAMADVAQAAGVSRQSLYNEFGSRGALAQAYVLWEGDRFLAAVEAALAGRPEDPVRALVDAYARFLESASEHPLVRALAAPDGEHELLPLVTTQGAPLHERATSALGALLRRHWPEVSRRDADLLADALVRLAISHAAMPAGSPRSTARALGALLGPFVEHATAA